MAISYTRERVSQSMARTRQFWNIHQAWSLIASALVGIGVSFLVSWHEANRAAVRAVTVAIVAATATYVVGWIGSFLVNYIWIVPGEMYREQTRRIEEQAKTIAQQSQTIERARNETPRLLEEVPIGKRDSQNRAFELTYAPHPPASLDLYLNGVRQTATEGYTLNGRVITFRVAPTQQDELTARYTY